MINLNFSLNEFSRISKKKKAKVDFFSFHGASVSRQGIEGSGDQNAKRGARSRADSGRVMFTVTQCAVLFLVVFSYIFASSNKK